MTARYVKATDAFEITWDNPADSATTWVFDQVHFPRPLPPLSMQLMAAFYEDVVSAPALVANGYGFFNNLTVPPPPQEIMERGLMPVWEEDYVPRIRAHCSAVRSAGYDSMSAAQLAEALDRLVGETVDLLRLTLVVVFPFMGPTLAFVQFCEDNLGPTGPVLAGTALQGYENESAASGTGLGALAVEAERRPAVADALRAGRFDGLDTLAGGSEFLQALHSYLDDYGWRVESWSLVHEPTWAEKPATPLSLVGRYLQNPDLSPSSSMRRSTDQRHAAVKKAETLLGPAKATTFHTLLENSRVHVGISESRALWQLILVGVFRIPGLALGRKLVAAGALAEPNDVFFLDVDELKAAAAAPDPAWRETVQQRKADLARFEQLLPPPFIGTPPDMAAMPAEMLPVFRHFFGVGIMPSEEARLVTGNPASGGIARGRARVIRTLAEAERLQPGDVLVCATTAAPWTPLFALASAVVADSGGVLSHSAICAREYAIPCVVGTVTGTRAIPDGAMVTVDGTAGTVTIDG